MRTIHKYSLGLMNGPFDIEMPQGARVVHVECQHSEARVEMWAMVETDSPMQTRQFSVIGTGHPCDHPDHQYMATAISPCRRFVWHVFDLDRKPEPAFRLL